VIAPVVEVSLEVVIVLVVLEVVMAVAAEFASVVLIVAVAADAEAFLLASAAVEFGMMAGGKSSIPDPSALELRPVNDTGF